ncbi:putative Zinc finger MYM-type protein, partial [Daphnia magna]
WRIFCLYKTYTYFFSASPHRWNILFKALGGKVVIKRLIDVRWSAHADAVRALDSGYNDIQSALNLIANDKEEDPKTINEAKSLSSKMDKLEYVILTSIWNRILSRFNMVSKTLQSE